MIDENEAWRKEIQDKAFARRTAHMRCRRCNNMTEERDGSEVGGLPGLRYKHCRACGFSRAITKPNRRPKQL